MATLGNNQIFEIKNGDGTPFHNLVLRKSTVESVVMSLGDKISGDVYYKDNTLSVTMHEYITYNGVNYMLINPPTIVREGVVSDNSELRGMTKYSFVFYHPMCQLSNFPFTDVAVTNDETRYLSESKTFSWIGKPADFVAKMNKNLDGTEWIVEISSRFPQDKLNELSDVIPFDNATIADACKTFYDTWGVPYVVDKVASTEASYATGKRFKLVMGLPSNEIYENAAAEQQQTPFVFQMGHGVGLKNNSRTPRNNKIITRISGYGSENNIPYGYPQVRWYGTAGQSFTYGDHAGVYTNVTIGGVHFDKVVSYPIYKGILNGEYVELIKHPFTRTHLMPSVYRTTLFNKISLYNDLGEVNTDYDPDITLVDYYDAVYSAQYPYPNTINLQAPSYESHEFEDEKPELGEAHIISATPLNNDLTPASSWDDSLDDEGNYKQSYFQMVLPQLSFDLYACASITEEMQINMRSGACLGCTFTVQVDWDDYKQNFYDEEGNFAPNGSQRDLTKYPKSNQGSISLVLQKDNSTFGTLMPNMYQYPKGETSSGAGDGDTFVILGISLPESYILAAEDRLDVDMKSYMLENNEHYFDYPLKFDEDFLFHNENILSQIRPNTVVRFNYAGQTQALFVKQITIKYGEQQLPQYDITLTDNVEVVLNQIGQVAEDVEKLSTLIAILRQSYGKNVWNELAKKLSKTQDDTAAGYITMLKGLQVGANFVPDILGEGGVLRMRDDGKVELVTDILYARVKAYFDTVEIREYQHTGGNRIASVAGNKICRVAWFNSSNVELEQTQANLANVAYFRCYFRASDGEDTVRNNWIIGDQAYCHITSIVNSNDNPEQKGLNQKHLWRLVIGRNTEGTLTEDGEAYIDLSNRANETISGTSYTGYQSGSDIPEAQDDIIQLGNVNDTTRQGAIVEFVTGTDAPSYQIYQGINSFSLNNKNQIGFGYNTGTGRAYMNVYGDTYIGDRNRNTFLEYKQNGAGGNPELNIKAKVQILPNGSTINGQSIPDYIKDNQNNYDDTEVQQAISDLNDAVGNLQDQIDGSIETLYGDVDPSVPANDPYKDYTTDEKEKHLGDMYYNSTTGYAYRYDKSVEEVGGEEVTTYFWQIIRDTGITQAIADAAAALGLAETKAKIFTTTAGTLPTPPYKINDVWVNATYPANGSTYSNEILKCVTARAQGATANIADWAKASKYTDDSSLQNFISATYDPTIAGLTEQVDRKIESWFQSADPSADWYDDTQTPVLDVRADHVGDMWYSESTHLLKRYDSETTGEGEQAVTTYFWTTIQDQKAIDAYDNAAHAQDTADGKRRVFTAQPVAADAYDVGDLWVNATYPATGTKTYENDVLRCKTAKAAGANFNISHWQKASKYTDDSALTNFVNGDYADTIAALEGQLDKKAETWYQAADPSSDWYVVDPETQEVTTDTRADHVGDLWYKTSDDTTWYYNATTSGGVTTYEWKQQNVPLAVFDKIDGKADIFVSKPSTYNKYDMWIIESSTTTCPNADIPDGCKRGDIVIAKNKRTNSYTKGDWEKKDRYTDDSAFNGYITAFLNGSGASGDSATAAAIQKAIAGALGSGTVVDGGLLLSSLIGMRKYKGSGSVTELSSYDTWGGISGEYNDDDETVEGGAKGHGIAAWYGGDMVDKEMLSDDEIANGWGTGEGQYRWAKSVDRFDGSGYRANGNITWNANGELAISDITSIQPSGSNTNVLNDMIQFSNAFHFNTVQGGSTILNIVPQYPFYSLYLYDTSQPNNRSHVASQKWVDDHYVSKTFFRQLFRAFKPNATAGQADVEVEPNTIDATISNIKAMVGLWTEQYVSALGNSSDGGGGGASVLYGLNDVSPNASNNQVLGIVIEDGETTTGDGYVLTFNGSTKHWYAAATAETYVLPQATANALGGIKIGYSGTTAKTYAVALDTNGKAYVNVPWTDHYAWSDITSKPNTIAGYGITDAKIENGVITLGSNTITPLTSHQSLADIMGSSAKGGTTQPIYWDGTAFKNTTYTLGKSVPSDAVFTDTWRNIFLDGTEELTTGINTKGLNFVGDGKTTISFLAAGTEEGQSGNAEYATLKISSTWRGMQNNLTTSSSSTTDSLSAYQGYLLANGSARDNTKLPLTGGTLTGNLTINPSSGAKYIQIGTIRIGYDSENNALKVYKVTTSNDVETEVAANFYALGAISALGQGVDGGGGGGQGDVTWDLLAHTATDNRFIDSSYISGALASYSLTSHTHTTTIAAGASTDTSQLTLAHGTKYKLTAGGTSFVFTMPSGYSLPTASSSTLGGVKVGSTLAISSGVLNLATSGVTAGTYKCVTVDAYGRVTAGDNTDSNTWRNIYLGGTSKVGTGTDTKALNFVAGSNVTISYEAAGTGDGKSGSADYFNIKIAATDTTYSNATQSAAGLMSAADKKKLDGVAEGANNYSLPLAASGTRGGVKIGYTTDAANRNYAVQLSSEKMYVNVPWQNTNTWRNILLAGTQKLGTGTDTKGLNFVGDGKTTITFLDAGTDEGQSGSADYATIKISSTWRGIQNNLTSDSTTDSLSAAQGKALKGSITTLEGYFTNGVAKSAAKLTTVSKKAWGQTFWTSGGVPTSISGALSSVTNITMSGYIKIGDAYLAYDSTNNAIKLYKLDANNQEIAANFYALGAISALGQGVDGGGGGQGDVTWNLLADNTDTRQIALSHLTTALAGYSTTSHTHTTTIAAGASGDTNQLTLAYGTKYKLTAGGTSFVFTMPSADDTNTWRNIYVAGTEKLTTAVNTKGLNFVAGSNVSLSFAAAGTGSGQSGNANYGTITIAATDTTYSAGTGISLSGTTFSNSGVRATTINGNYLRVNTNGTNADLTIPYATTANQLKSFGIPYNRPVSSGGNGKQWERICTFTDTEVPTKQKWYGKFAEIEFYTNGYGSSGNYTYLGRVSFCVRVGGQTSIKNANITIKWQDSKKSVWDVNHFKAVVTDTSVEFFVLDDIWDTSIFAMIIKYDGLSFATPSSSDQYTESEFTTYCSGKTVIDAIQDTNIWVGNADYATKATQDGSGNTITSTYLKLSGGTMSGNLSIVTSAESSLTLGNTSDGVKGAIYLYAQVSRYTKLTSAATGGSREVVFPNASGTVALTSDLNSYLPLSGGTIYNADFAPLFIQRNHTTNAAAIGFKHYSSGTTVEVMGYIGMNAKDGDLIRWNNDHSAQYNILDSNNSSVSLSGSTLSVKIDGTTKSLTNTNTWRGVYTDGTSRAGNGIDTKGVNFVAGSGISIGYAAAGTGSGQSGNANYFNVSVAVSSSVLQQGSVIDTHHEGNGTITLDGTNELYAFYDRGGTCDAYEVEQSATLTNQTLTRTSTAVAKLSANVFNGMVGYNQTDGIYSGEKFAVYDLALPANYPYGANFFWSFGNDTWKPAKMRVLVGQYSASGFTYISKYSTDSCPAYGKVSVGNGATGFNRLRIVVSKYSRLACFGVTFYDSRGLRTTFMNRCLDDAVYRNINPAKDNTWSLGTSSLRWKEVRAVNLYGSLTGNASTATALQTSRTLWGQSFNGSANVDGTMNISGTSGSYNQGIRIHTFTGASLSSVWFRATNADGYQAGMWGISVDDNGMRFRGNTSKTATSDPADYMNILHGGNVGIGTDSPTYKLHVGGSFRASGNSSIGGTFGVTGATTLTGLLTANGNIATGTSDGAYVQIGGARIVWDNTNKALKVIQSDNSTAANFYATGAISALGQGVDGSGGGGQGDVTWALLASQATGGRTIHSSYISGTLANYLPLSGGTMSGDIKMPQNTYIYGANENYGGMLFWDGTRTVVGSVGASTTAATHLRSKTGHATIGTDNTATYNILDSGNSSVSLSGSTLTVKINGTEKSLTNTDINVKVNSTNPTTGTWYYPVWYTNTSGTGNVCANDGLLYFTLEGTTSALGHSYLRVGNTTAEGTVGNKCGHLRIYGSSSYYGQIDMGTLTADRTFTLPNAGGTIALTSDLSNYLPLSGGTMSLAEIDSFIIRKTSNNHSYIRFDGLVDSANARFGYLGFYGVNNPSFRNTSNTTYKLWHEGNDGADSGLDADKLDGQHGSYYAAASSLSNYLALAGGTVSGVIQPNANSTINLGANGKKFHYLYVHRIVQCVSICNGTTYDANKLDLPSKSGTIAVTSDLDSYLPLAGGTMTGNITMNNAVYLYGKNTGGTSYILAGLSGGNDFILGYGTAGAGYNSYLDGNNIYLRYGTSSTTGFCLNSSGNVGIGTSSPSYKLHVSGQGYFTSNLTVDTASATSAIVRAKTSTGSICIDCESTYRGIYDDTASKWLIATNGSGNVGIGTTSPASKLHVAGTTRIATDTYRMLELRRTDGYGSGIGYYKGDTLLGDAGFEGGGKFQVRHGSSTMTTTLTVDTSGNLTASGGVSCLQATSSSDIRIKNVVSDRLPLSVEQIADAPTIKFTWKEKPELGTQVGSIAQYWQKVLPDVVKIGNDEMHTLSLSYGVAALVAAITTARKVVDHEREIAQLKERVKALEDENKMLKTKLIA